MHTISEMGTSVPAFLGKLWRLVEDPETDDLISWAPNGRSFFIKNQAQFARELLPHYYKHNNMASFVRQLNMYGFHKKVSVELGGLKCDRDEMEFAHQYFCKDHPYLLDHIKRKIASNKSQDPSQQPIKPELMNKMLTEVRSMRGRQEHFDSRLTVMKRENESLWRELALLRQKHLKQQQIVEKLIHFLMSLVNSNSNSGLGLKRRYPLMIDDASRQRIKQNKLSKVQNSPSGPAIHELDASDLDSGYIVAEMLDSETTPTVQSPEHSITEENMREYYIDDSIEFPQELESSQNANGSRKRIKDKKKGRKSNVPIKILIPASENGKESRQETYLLEIPIPTTKVQVIPTTTATTVSPKQVDSVLKSTTTTHPKPVPLATVRSSKLAAMAANMKKNKERSSNFNLQSLQEQSDDNDSSHDSMIKLEDILIVPDIDENYNPEMEEKNGSTIPSNVNSLSSRGSNNSPGISGLNVGDHNPDVITDMSNRDFDKLEFMNDTNNELATSSLIDSDNQKPSSSMIKKSQKDLQKNMLLSRVNQGSTSKSDYRLESMEEIDNHIDSMQSELDDLKEALRDNNQLSIDANTLLGLFGTEDSMYPFGFPISQELDLQEKDIDDDHQVYDPLGLHNKGEIMTYNTGQNLLDFEEDIFLGVSSPSPAAMVTDGTNEDFGSDPLIDNKGNIFDSLIANNQKSQT